MKRMIMGVGLVILITTSLLLSCAPSQTTQEPVVKTTEEQRREAEQHYSIGFEYYKQSNYDEAIKNFNKAIELWPGFYGAYIALAKTHRAKLEKTTAESLYKRARTIDPNDPRAYEGLGVLYAEQKRFTEAIAEYEGGLEKDSTNVNLLNGLGYVYKEMGQHRKAIDYYNKSLLYERENLSTQYAIADVYIQMSQPDMAISYLKDIVAKRSDNMEVVEKLGETLLELKRYAEAEKEYIKLIENKPDNYYYHLKLGEAYQRQKKYQAADQEFQAARRLASDKALPLYYLVDLNITRGKYGTAEQLAKEALTIEPSNRYAYLLLGDVYQRRAIIARNQWVKDKSTKNCSILNNAMSYFKSAISYYTKAKPDAQCTQYCNNEITRASNLIEELEEDKWFYCKGGS